MNQQNPVEKKLVEWQRLHMANEIFSRIGRLFESR
jgi:hypothetical protein